MCDDLKAEMTSLAKKGVKCSEVEEAVMGFNYENAASRRRRGRPVSTEAPDRLRLRIEMKHQRQLFGARSPSSRKCNDHGIGADTAVC
jgi:hypothetical protein